MGGEKCYVGESKSNETGSPPRGRGKVVLNCKSLPQLGITPAWAGKSETVCLPVLRRWDHPRVGGEKCDLLSLRL